MTDLAGKLQGVASGWLGHFMAMVSSVTALFTADADKCHFVAIISLVTALCTAGADKYHSRHARYNIIES